MRKVIALLFVPLAILLIAALPPTWGEPGEIGPWLIYPTATAKPYTIPVQVDSHEADAEEAYPAPVGIEDAYPAPTIVEVDMPDGCAWDNGVIVCTEPTPEPTKNLPACDPDINPNMQDPCEPVVWEKDADQEFDPVIETPSGCSSSGECYP